MQSPRPRALATQAVCLTIRPRHDSLAGGNGFPADPQNPGSRHVESSSTQECKKMNAAIHRTRLAALFLLAALPYPAFAVFLPTAEEVAMCNATIFNRYVKGDPNWSFAHHFCDCVRFTHRANGVKSQKSKEQFNWYVTQGSEGCDKVLENTSPDFVLLPEVHLQKGLLYSLQKQDAKAAAAFTKAIDGNPRLPKAYAELAGYYVRMKNKKTALETVTRGLQNNPESKVLKRLYKELGGTLPFPEPAQAAPSPAATEAKPQAPEPAAVEPSAVKAATEAPVNPTIGAPNNPWCRFCTEMQAAPAAATPSTPGVIPKAER